MTDFKAIQGINVAFEEHPTVANAHKQFNIFYGGVLPDFKELFTDDTMTKLKPDAVELILSTIVEKQIIPDASQTVENNVISPLLKAGRFTISHGTNPSYRLTRNTLRDTMNSIIASNTTPAIVNLKITIGHMYFPPNSSYLDWGVITTSPPAATPVTASSPGPPAISMADVTNAIAAQTQSLTAAITGIAQLRAPIPSGSAAATATTQVLFNPAALPADVRDAYNVRQANQVILGSSVAVPFADGFRHYLDGADRLFLRDGSLFVIRPIRDEKGLNREPPTCKDDSPHGRRIWYNSFQRHAMDNGFYVHPLYCFRKDQGGHRGFSAGNGADDDLPLRLLVSLDSMSQPLFKALSKKDMFPPGSQCAEVLQLCTNDGFMALKQLIFNSHPVFEDQPATLITAYPIQKNHSLLKYHSLFRDFLQLRAFISNQKASLDDPHELDIFITNATHGVFLNRVTREERMKSSLAHKYKGNQIC